MNKVLKKDSIQHPFINKVTKNALRTGQFLCVGLDPEPHKVPVSFGSGLAGVEQYFSAIIDTASDYCVAFKPNISFFEALGLDGLYILQRLIKRIPEHIPVILDAKRGDIGNTSAKQAAYLFEVFGADASTLHPYMGEDSVFPFFDYKDKFHFVLGLTSNPGSKDFECLVLQDGRPLYEAVVSKCLEWNKQYTNIGLVVGAQKRLANIRCQVPYMPFLIPGVGAQGGSYLESLHAGSGSEGLVLINVSRGLLYPEGYEKRTPQNIQRLFCEALDNLNLVFNRGIA